MPRPIEPRLPREPLSRPALMLLACLGALLSALLHLPGGRLLSTVDWTRFHVFNREYLYQALRHGRLPLWNPHVALGRPFLADVETAFFYPPNLLYLVLSPNVGMVILVLAHAGLLTVGMAVLAQRLALGRGAAVAVALAFTCSGVVSAPLSAGQVLWFQGIAYIPIALTLAMHLQDRPSVRRVASLALVLGLQLLSTHPQLFWMQTVAGTVFLLIRGWPESPRLSWRPWLASLGAWMAAHAWCALLVAAQYLPFVELIGQGNRQVRSLELASGWSLAPSGLASLLLPLPLNNWSDDLYSGSALAVLGLGGLVLSRDRDARALTAVALFSTILALGATTPLFALAFHVLPGLSFFRAHGRFALWLVLPLFLLAGRLLDLPSLPRRQRLVLLLLTIAASGLALAHPDGRQVVGAWPRSAWLLGAGLLASLWIGRLDAKPLLRHCLAGLLVAVTLVESMVGAHVTYRTLVEPRPYPAEPLVAEVLARQGLLQPGQPPPRVAIPYPIVRENAGMRHGWSTFSGYVGLWLGRTWNYVHRAAGLETPVSAVAFPAANVYRGPFPLRETSTILGLDPQSRQWALASAPAERAQVVGAAQLVQGGYAEALRYMVKGYDIRQAALVEEAIPSLPDHPPEGWRGQARIVDFAPEVVTVEVEASHAGLLALGEAYYPGWSAQIGSEVWPCVPANAWMRAVAVPAGRHTVIFRYRSTWLREGVLLSILSLSLILLVLRRRHAPES